MSEHISLGSLGETPLAVATVTSSDPISPVAAPADVTVLNVGGGYVGQPTISTAGGYGGVIAVNAPPTGYEIGYMIGQFISNNILWIGLGVGALLLLKGGRRR